MDIYMALGLPEGGQERKVVALGESPRDVDIFPRDLGKEDDEGNFNKISGMMKSLSLPSELMSFALTYEKAYCSSLFMGDCWTADSALSKIDMPIRMRLQRPQKAKFGCSTCKVRRVKCDELKPTCLRCQKMGLKCGGYNVSQRESTRSYPAITRRAMAPKLLLLYPYSLPEVSLFHTDMEYQYFKTFSEKARQDGEHNVFLQICQSEPVLRRAAIMLVALEKMSTALSDSKDVARKFNARLLDSAIGDGRALGDGRRPDAVEQVERSKKQLLSFMCLIYRKKLPSDREPGWCKARLESISSLHSV